MEVQKLNKISSFVFIRRKKLVQVWNNWTHPSCEQFPCRALGYVCVCVFLSQRTAVCFYPCMKYHKKHVMCLAVGHK